MEHPLTPALIALQALEENFTLAVVVFIVGLVATLITVVYIIAAHRYWERRDDSNEEEVR